MTQIVVNHLTRMKGDRICVAGFDPDTGIHIRPVTPPGAPLTRELLASTGGPLAFGNRIDLGPSTPSPNPPEVEDHSIPSGEQLRLVGQLPASEYLELLTRVAKSSPEEIFGPELKRTDNGWKFFVEQHAGTCSLGCLQGTPGTGLSIDDQYERERLTLKLPHPDQVAFLAVTDLRFFEADGSIRRDAVSSVQDRLKERVPFFLMVGLARAFPPDNPRHWLQVNGICMHDAPMSWE